MVNVNGAYKHGRYEKKMWSSLRVMSNIKVFAMLGRRPARWPTGRTRLTTQIHMILMWLKKKNHTHKKKTDRHAETVKKIVRKQTSSQTAVNTAPVPDITFESLEKIAEMWRVRQQALGSQTTIHLQRGRGTSSQQSVGCLLGRKPGMLIATMTFQ